MFERRLKLAEKRRAKSALKNDKVDCIKLA